MSNKDKINKRRLVEEFYKMSMNDMFIYKMTIY